MRLRQHGQQDEGGAGSFDVVEIGLTIDLMLPLRLGLELGLLDGVAHVGTALVGGLGAAPGLGLLAVDETVLGDDNVAFGPDSPLLHLTLLIALVEGR